MFSGIINHTGEFVKLETQQNNSCVLTIKSPSIASQVSSGDSVSVNGVCLTVVDYDHENVTFDLLEETLKVTNLGKLKEDSVINLELSIKMSDYISGHLVSGHVDFTSELLSVDGETHKFSLDQEFMHLIAHKGSVAINGVSLTSCQVSDSDFCVYLIPETLSRTNLGKLKVGDVVNIEIDLLARYLDRLLTKRK